MPVRAKICGLSTPETIHVALRHGASHIGLVFFAPSPRNLDFGDAQRFAALIPPQVGRVGVFVDPDDALVAQAVASAPLSVLQLHQVTPARAAQIRAQTGLETWAAIAVRERADLAVAPKFVGAADRLLFDAKTPPGAALPGGMGVRFDWELLRGFAHSLPWALSGGLTADNVGEAVNATGAALVDASSGLETAPGIKDVDKIAAFLKAVAQL